MIRLLLPLPLNGEVTKDMPKTNNINAALPFGYATMDLVVQCGFGHLHAAHKKMEVICNSHVLLYPIVMVRQSKYA